MTDGLKSCRKGTTMIANALLGFDQIPDGEIVETGQEEVKLGEEVKGVLPLRLRKLATSVYRYAKMLEVEATQLIGSITDLNDPQLKSLELRIRGAELLKVIFWQEIREEFNLREKNLSLRKGWKVVVDGEDEILDQLVESVVISAISQGDCGDPNCPIHGRKNRQRPFIQRPGQA